MDRFCQQVWEVTVTLYLFTYFCVNRLYFYFFSVIIWNN